MSLWRQLSRGLRALANRRAADAELNDEVLDYLDRTASANVARGMTHSAAHRAARVELGNPTVTESACATPDGRAPSRR